MSSTSRTSTSRYRLRKPSCLPSRIMLMNSLVNSSELTYLTLRPVVERLRVVADGVQQVRLAQAGVAVDEQRVVGLGGRLGDRDGGGVREPVAAADDEGLERVLRVQPGGGRARRLVLLLPAPAPCCSRCPCGWYCSRSSGSGGPAAAAGCGACERDAAPGGKVLLGLHLLGRSLRYGLVPGRPGRGSAPAAGTAAAAGPERAGSAPAAAARVLRHAQVIRGASRASGSITDSGELGGPGGCSGGVTGLGSTVTAIWIGRPSSLESAWMTSGRSLVSRCSLTKGFGVAISAVFSTRPSGLVSLSQASWLAGSPISASPSRDRAHTSARSTSLTDALPSPRRIARAAADPTARPPNRNSLSTGSSTRCVRALQCGFPIPWRQPAHRVATCGP